MKALIVGGNSSVAIALKPVLSGFCEVTTAGRADCDIFFDLNQSYEEMSIPENVDALIHTAAHFGGNSEQQMREAVSVNVLGTLKLCQAAVRARVKHFVLISSVSAVIKDDSNYYSIYALSKKQSEEVAKYYCSKSGLPLTILRPSQLYGESDRFRRHQPFLYQMIDNAQRGDRISIYGSHDALRNYIHINDFVEIVARVMKSGIVGVFSCIQMSDVSFSQIAKAAFLAFDHECQIDFMKDKPDIVDNVFDKDDTLYKRINFFPRVSIEEGLRKIASRRKSEC